MPQPNRRLRLLVPLIVGALAALILAIVITGPGGANNLASKQDTPAEATAATTPPTAPAEEPPAEAKQESTTASAPAPETPTETTPDASVEPVPESTPATAPAPTSIEQLHLAEYPVETGEPVLTLGSLDDPTEYTMQLAFTRTGAGASEIAFSNIWNTAAAKRQADMYYAAKQRGDTSGYSLPAESERYILQREHPIAWMEEDEQGRQIKYTGVLPILAANELGIESGNVTLKLNLFEAKHWKQTAPGQFEATVLNKKDEPVARIHRHWILGSGYDITLKQEFENLGAEPLKITWGQYGPSSLLVDRSRYMDRRRFRFGYEYSESFDPKHVADVIAEGDMVMELTDASSDDSEPFWPNDLSDEEGFTLSWFASTNRYFALAVFPVLGPDGQGSRSLAPLVQEIGRVVFQEVGEPLVLSGLISPEIVVDGGTSHDLSIGIFAGPLEREMLDEQEPYKALNMGGLILYQMSSFCAFCTFQWLANILVVVLGFLDHYVLFDWAMAIIGLVVIVRVILHPITRRSQSGMQRFTRKMSKLKPQMEKINQKYADDPKRKQREQMKLMREHGVNPLQMLGCLPMFLQMPVWVALYAVLYFAFELRQEPAFWGVFQVFWDWPFLADLSSPDHFFYEFKEPHSFLLWNLTGINLLPILLGVLFFIQQKYMTPPSAGMSPEQESQQKIMRVMMIGLFPLMLYSAPSGLTLYILTSSTIGIFESRHIRRQVEREEEDPTVIQRPVKPSSKKIKDPQGRAYAKTLERRKAEARQKNSKNYKKRK